MSARLTFTILGCGPAGGVPRPGGDHSAKAARGVGGRRGGGGARSEQAESEREKGKVEGVCFSPPSH